MYQNLEAERSVIGAMLYSNGKESVVTTAMTLTEDDFTTEASQGLFRAAKALYQEGVKIDIVTLGTKAQDMGVQVSAKELLKLASYVPTTANIRTYVANVRECSDRRKIRAIADKLSADSESGNISELCYETVRKLNNGHVTESSWQNMTSIMVKAFDRIEAIRSGNLQAVKTGITNLDKIFGGFFPGELTIVAARPSVGKSAFALFVAMNAARKGKKVAFVSREMSPEAIANRMISQNDRLLRGEKLRDGKFETSEEWEKLGDTINELSKLDIYTVYNIRAMEELHQEARNLANRANGVDLLIVDYAQLMHMGGRTDSRVEELEEISGSLKELAMGMQVPVIALAQVKRSGSRVAVMPTMDELKGSGSFEQDADNIILLHRPEVDTDDYVAMRNDKELFHTVSNSGNQYIVIKIAKQRQGEVGGTSVIYDPAHNTYTSIGREIK